MKQLFAETLGAVVGGLLGLVFLGVLLAPIIVPVFVIMALCKFLGGHS